MVYCDFSGSMNDAIVHGLRISQIFQKELCLFHPYATEKKDAKRVAQKALGMIIRKLKEDYPEVAISSLTLKGNLSQTITLVAEEYDGIMLVASVENLKLKIQALQRSQIPFLFIDGSSVESLRYDRVMLPVDYRKVMKYTSLWASYFGRFNQSAIEVLNAREKNASNQNMVKKNCKFITHLLSRFKLDVAFRDAQKASFGLPSEALERCRTASHNLMIIPSSQQINLIDLIVGLPETKLIKQAGPIPIICINPRRDMYILCD